MKKILFAAVAALAITGCSQNEEFDAASQKAEINFTPVVNKSTRAAITDLAALKTSGFKVFAYNTGADGTGALNKTIMGGVDVTSVDGAWKYSGGPYYWPTDSKVSFFAYAPAASTAAAYAVTTPASDTTPTITYTVPAVENQEDFVVAKAVSDKDVENGVVLPFTHALCQVNFSVVGEDNLTYTISSLEITGVANKGTYNFGDSWDVDTETTSSYSYPLGTPNPSVTDGVTKILDQEDGALMLLPQTFTAESTASIKVSYVVTDANGNTVYTATDKTVDLKSTKAWTIAKKMRYTLTLTNGAKSISFGDPTVGGWDTEEDSETPSVPKN